MKKLIKQHPYILLFGIFQIFFSAPGQTFLISLFVSPIFDDLHIPHTAFAGIYSGATLLAALLLNPAGRLIDKYPTHHIVKGVTLLMAVGCLIIANAHNALLLFVGFFMVRLIGQGVFTLTASTVLVKSFEKNIAKAMGVGTLGFPLSEAVYPFLVLAALKIMDWRMVYVLLAISNLIIMLPFQLVLLKKSKLVHGHFFPGESLINPQRLPGNPDKRTFQPHKSMTLKAAMKDFKFYLILIASCLPPMVVTGIFFHQHTLYKVHNWPFEWAAMALMIYALLKALSSLGVGVLVDKYGPLLPFVGLIILMGGATIGLSFGGEQKHLILWYSLIGISLGCSSPVSNVVWPYFYGTKYMGSIKGFIATIRNGVTALAPLPIAMAQDYGITIQSVFFWVGVTIIGLSILPMIVFWTEKLKKPLEG